MQYTKEQQLKRPKKTRKVCIGCNKNRDMKFYDTPRTRKCKDCKRRAKRIKRQSSKSYITKKLDKQWADAVKKRDGYNCQYCGAKKQLNAHHIFSRSNKNLRHDIENGITLCPKHHTFSSEFSAHLTPVEFVEWIKEFNGEDWYNKLRKKAKGVGQ